MAPACILGEKAALPCLLMIRREQPTAHVCCQTEQLNVLAVTTVGPSMLTSFMALHAETIITQRTTCT